MRTYKVSGIMNYLNFKTIKDKILKEIKTDKKNFKLKYSKNADYAYFTLNADDSDVPTEILFKNSKWKIKMTETKEYKIEENNDNIDFSKLDIRDSVTPLWKLNYSDQINLKKDEIEKFYSIKIEYKENKIFYRNNFQFAFGFTYDNIPALGYKHREGKSKRDLVFNINDCENISKKTRTKIARINELLKECPDLIYKRSEQTGYFRLAMVRENENEDMCLIQVYDDYLLNLDEGNRTRIAENIKNIISLFPYDNIYLHKNTKNWDVFVKDEIERVKGVANLGYIVSNCKFEISFFSFFQTNTFMAKEICNYLQSLDYKNENLIDLCCGSGLYSIVLNQKFKKIKGIEINEDCIRDGLKNIEINNIENVQLIKIDVDKFRDYEASSVILNPPRKGVGKKTIQKIRKSSNINEIIYISCDYKASYQNILDLCKETSKNYLGNQFEIHSIVAFDMFPLTNNSEVVIRLLRN